MIWPWNVKFSKGGREGEGIFPARAPVIYSVTIPFRRYWDLLIAREVLRKCCLVSGMNLTITVEERGALILTFEFAMIWSSIAQNLENFILLRERFLLQNFDLLSQPKDIVQIFRW